MRLDVRAALRADARAPSLARAFVTAEFARTTPSVDVPVDDLVLVVSELVTNAVKAGSTRVTVALHADADGLELSVDDDAEGAPRAQHATPESLGGRGLAIVGVLAHAWSCSPTPDARGKRVTARWLSRDGQAGQAGLRPG